VYVVLDFEATCEDQQVTARWEPQEVIEFPLVIVDGATGTQLSEFRTFVRPVHRPQLTEFCTRLTGIQQSTVDEAPSWGEAFHQAQAWLDSELKRLKHPSCILVTCGDWDLRSMLPRQCALSGMHVPDRFRKWLNIKNLFHVAMKRPGKGMLNMLNGLGLKLQGRHHSGLDDSRNIAAILKALLLKGAVVDESMLSSSAQAGPLHKSEGKGKGDKMR